MSVFRKTLRTYLIDDPKFEIFIRMNLRQNPLPSQPIPDQCSISILLKTSTLWSCEKNQ